MSGEGEACCCGGIAGVGSKGGEEIFKFTRSAIAPEGAALETVGASAVAVEAAGVVVVGVGFVLDSLGFQASSSNPLVGVLSDDDSVRLPLVTTAFG